MSLKTLIRKEDERSSNQALLIDSNHFISFPIKHVQSVAHIVQDCTSTSINAQSLAKDPSHPRDIPATEAELCCAANLRSLAMLYFDTLRQNWDAAYDAGTGSTAATLEPTKAHLREGLSNQVKAPVFWFVLMCFADSQLLRSFSSGRHSSPFSRE